MKSYSRSLAAFFWHFIRQHSLAFTVILLAMTTWSVAESLTHYFVKLIIDAIVEYRGDPSDVWPVVLMPVLGYVGITILLDIGVRVEDFTAAKTVPVVRKRMRASMFGYAAGHSYRFFQDNFAGDITGKIAGMARNFETVYRAFAQGLYPVLVTFVITAYLLWTVHAAFAIFLVIWFALMIGISAFMSRRSLELASEQGAAENRLIGQMVDIFQNILIVRSFSSVHNETSYLNRYQDDEVKKAKRVGMLVLRIHLAQGVLSTVMLTAMIVLLVLGWQRGYVTAGDFAFVTSTSFAMIRTTWWAAEQLVVAYREMGLAKQSLKLMQEPHQIKDAEGAKPIVVTRGEIVFDDVTFQYVPGRNIFENKNIVIHPGENVGLIGFSGSGKTTFINLIMRFFDVESGRILIDGQDISQVTQESLRQSIAVISQDPSLFHRTLMENIRVGLPSATDEEVMEAAKLAHCHDFIMQLPLGYNTVAGERGVKVSGGQRQRIAIARAILKNAPILFLDEATSALDSMTEQDIQESLAYVMRGRTVIAIAHRLSTLLGMNRILVFKDGEIVEDGTHDELYEQKGYYTQLWDMQAGGYIPDDA